MSQKFPVNNFEYTENSAQFNKDFTKTYNGKSDKGYFLDVDVQFPKNLQEFHNDLPFLAERMKSESL